MHRAPLLQIVLLSALIPWGYAQEPPAWQPIPPEELDLRDNPAHPGDAAMILYLEVYDDDVKRFETEYVRIKVFKEEGRKYANIEIPYSTQLNVEEIRARTVQPDGTAVEFHGEVLDQVYAKYKKANLRAKVIALPDVQVGSVIEYWYRLRWKEKLPDFVVSPQDYGSYLSRAFTWGATHWSLDLELAIRRARFTLKPAPKAKLLWVSDGLPPGISPERQSDGTIRLEVENRAGIEDGEYMLPRRLLTGRVDFYYEIGTIASSTAFWVDVARWRTDITEKFIGKSKAIQKAVDGLTRPGDTPEAKLRKIYTRAQQVRFLSYEEARTEKEASKEGLDENKNVDDVLKHNYAYANEINMLFTAMARAAGFDARIVYLAARDTSYFVQRLPDEQQLNAVVVSVQLGGKEMFFDPATRFCPFGLLPWEESAAKGIRLNNPTSHAGLDVFVTTTSPGSDQAVTQRIGKFRLSADGALDGHLNLSFSGQEALQQRIASRLGDESGKREDIEDQAKAWLPGDADLHIEGNVNWDAADEPLRASGTLRLPGRSDVTSRRILLPISVFEAGRPRPFHHTQRQWPVYFSYPYQQIDEVEVEVPAGYRVEALPRNRQESVPFARFETTVRESGGRIHFTRRLEINSILLLPEHYDALRTFFDKVKTSDEERVVLNVSEQTTGK